MTIDLANILDTSLSSQNTRNSISSFQNFLGKQSPRPPRGLCTWHLRGFIWSLKNIPNLHNQKVGQSGISDQSFRRGGEHMKVEVRFQFV